MAAGPIVNQGKTAFVEEYFARRPDGNLEAVNEAWAGAGNEGSVSESLVGKVRARLGLTGKKAADQPRPNESRARAGRAARRAKGTRTAANGPRVPSGLGSASASTSRAATGPDDDVLDDLEEGIDELIHKIREVGGRPDVVKALRRARRLLVRGLEG